MAHELGSIREFWDERAELGEIAGTNDFMLTKIEQDFIASVIPNRSRVLDIGCGNSQSLIRLAKEKECTGVGIDFSESMIEVSKRFVASNGLQKSIDNYRHAVPPVPKDYGAFDVVLSNRALINLSDVELQRQAVQSVSDVLVPGGTYLMIECSKQGAEITNLMRKDLGLEPIEAPWHNLFFDEEDIDSWQSSSFRVEEFLHISSTYNFVSRVIYAKLAEIVGEELKYDSELNKIALMLPQQISEFGPVKCWKWRKE
jgi:SAM-dependent methyltransferase|tara:strand:+ start:667 stop:1437 length:771 start_codon:yes stop_codon:yes gene_type:complete